MRRALFSAFLCLTAFSVFGGNFLQVTAPTIAGEVGEFETRAGASRVPRDFVPAGATRLSAEPVALTVVQSLPPSPADVSSEHAPANGEVHEAPIEVREESADVARVADTRETLFVSTWMELPMAAAHYLGFAGLDAVRPASDLAAERSPGAPERYSPSDSRLPRSIAAIPVTPAADLSIRPIEAIPAAPAPAAFRTGVHNDASSAFGSVAEDRTEAVRAETSSARSGADIIATETEALATEFTRQRGAEEPQAPAYAAPQTMNGQHIAFNDSLVSNEERGPSGAVDVPGSGFGLLDMIVALYEPPASIFDRRQPVSEPQAPAMFAVASDTHSGLDNGHIAQDNRGPAAHAETAAASASLLERFVAAMTELPSTIFSPRALADEPAAPATVAYSTNSHELDAVAGVAVPDDRGEVAAAEVATSSTVPASVAALAEVPSNVINGRPFADLPAAPAIAPAVNASADHSSPVSGSTSAAADRGVAHLPERGSYAAPVAITANSSMSTAMLTPMDRNVLVDAPLAAESAITASNAGDLTTQFDRAVAPLAAAERVAPAQPVLISGRTEFSTDLLKPMNATTVNPFVKLTAQEELAAIQSRDGFCDPNWIGPPIRFSQTVELKLEDLINQLHQRFGVNFILGSGVAALPLNVKAGSIPWNVLLRSQLFVSGVRARCIDANTIELVQNTNVNTLQDMADVETRFIKLKFLQRTGSGTVDLANRSQGSNQGGQGGGCGGNSQGGTTGGGGGAGGAGGGGGGQQGTTVGQLTNNKYDKLIVEIEKILGLRSMTESAAGGGGDQGGGGSTQRAADIVRTNRFVTEIPGRNILAISATKEEHALIQEFIRRADRPPFQVAIKALVYTANQDRIRDIGVQTTITGGTADGRTTGGVFGDTLGTGTLFDFSTVIGTFDFNVQATAFQQNGLISVKSRPFATVIDGLCTTLDVGRQLPIVIDSTLGGQGDVVFVNAANNLAVTPYVLDDDNGNPFAVTLELRLAANDIDSSVTARGVPAISARSIQTQLLLDENKTAILGGFTVDSDSRTDRKVPGLGDIPIIGELFRRRIRDARVNRLYFAISVDVIVYPDPIRTVDVPGATTEPPSITPKQKRQADKMEPEQVIAVPTPKGP